MKDLPKLLTEKEPHLITVLLLLKGQFALFVDLALSTRGCFTMDTNVSTESSFSLLLPQME